MKALTTPVTRQIFFFFIFLFLCFQMLQAQSGSDLCTSADTISVTTGSATMITMDLSSAAESAVSVCESPTSDYPDVWFTFTPSFNGNVRIFNTNSGNSFTFYDSCGGAEIRCFFGSNKFLYNVSTGTTYWMKAARRSDLITGAGMYDFNIQGYAGFANDECGNASPLAVSTSEAVNVNYNLGGASESIDASCDFAGSFNHDIWYSFTAPVTGNIAITGASANNSFTLFDSCGGTEERCFFGNGYFYDVTGGITYILRVGAREVFAANNFSFNIQAHAEVPNDDCSNAIPLAITNTSAINVAYSPSGASESTDASCENMNSINHDLWYTFTAPVTGNIFISNASGFTTFSLYDTCGGTDIRCFIGSGFFYNVSGGTSYVLRVAVRDVFAGNDYDFDIQGIDDTENDECENATPLTVTDTLATTAEFEPAGASENIVASCENTGNINHDTWYTFTAPVTGNIHISNASGLNTFTLFDTCGGTQDRCFKGRGFFYTVVSGSSYLLRVSTISQFAGSSYTFDLQGFERVPNDTCHQAIPVTVTTDSATNVSLDFRGASEVTIASCENVNNINHDMWYSFTSPTDGNIQITNSSGLITYSLFSDCGTELTCFAGNHFFFSVTTGTAYWLRAATLDVFAGPFDFDIQAHPHPVNDTCANAIPVNIASLEKCTDENVTVDVRGALDEGITTSCDIIPINMDVWYAFTPALDGNVILKSNSGFNKFAVYDACSGNEIACFNGNDTIKNVLAGQEYLIQTWRDVIFAGVYTFCLEQLYDISTDGTCSTSGPITINSANFNNDTLVPFLDTSDDLIVAINANGNDLGDVNVSLYLDSADTRTFNGHPYLKRAVEIQAENQPDTPVTVRLYLLESELDSLISADPNLSSIFGLEVLRASLTCAMPFTDSGEFILATGSAYGDDSYFIEFEVDSFSTFYPTSTDFTILPIELLSFSGNFRVGGVHLSWSTASEANGSHFEVYRSNNGRHFESIGTVMAKGESHQVVNYKFVDEKPFDKLNYYKLKQVDLDGLSEWSNVIVVEVHFDLSGFKIYPNPTNGIVNIAISEELIKYPLEIFDINGVLVNRSHIASTTQQFTLPDRQGLYLIRIGDKNVRVLRR